MSITSPLEFLTDLDIEFFKRYRPLADVDLAPVDYVEPDLTSKPDSNNSGVATALDPSKTEGKPQTKLEKITSKIVTLGDFVDTDAVGQIPSSKKLGIG